MFRKELTRYKRKAVSLMLSAVMLTCLAACGGDKSDGEDETNKAVDNEPVTEKQTDPPEPDIERPDANTVTAYDKEGADYKLSINAGEEVHDISDLLYGIFIEDINFAADGGLYAEKIANRSFEFTKLAQDDEMYKWSVVGTAEAAVTVDDKEGSLNENNTNYLVISNSSGASAGVENKGFLDGISVVENAKYNISLYAKGLEGYTGAVEINIAANGEILASGKVEAVTDKWAKYSLQLTSSKTASSGVTLQVLIGDGKAAVDMVSMFPEDTYKGRENGLRKDLAEMLEALKPSFLRFPGGCVIEGYDIDSAYDWKDSIGVGQDRQPLLFNGTYGDVAAREQGTNIWTDINAQNDKWPSFMTYGLGFYEYFLLAEDLGAVGVPVLNCGLYCQARGRQPVDINSQLFEQYIQDALDLVEFCRGDANTTWGKVRVSLGHEEPFELKYIGIGNENWGNDYFERYVKFVEAFDKAKNENPALYDGIEIMFSAGVDDGVSGADYIKAYQFAEKWLGEHNDITLDAFAGAIDHHYYNDPEWFLQNVDYYDEGNYARESLTGTKFGGAIDVFLGEYAAKSNTLEAALAEAAYMTGIERNGDIIRMAAYAPLFGNLTATHWSPDLIWFNNSLCTGSINYYVQKIFSNNVGSKLLKSELEGADFKAADMKGMVGVGTWNTSAVFDNVKVVNNDTNEVYGEQDFETDTFVKSWFNDGGGSFKINNGALYQSSTNTTNDKIGSTAYFGDIKWENYTYTVDATKVGGKEGFLIPFAVQTKDNNYFWNIGGWNNTVSCLQQVSGGVKSDQLSGTIKDVKIESGKTYKLKVVVAGQNVKCYIDDELYVDYDISSGAKANAYQVVSTDETGDIIVKLVNITDSDRTLAVDIAGLDGIADEAAVYQVAGKSLKDDNILGNKEACIMEEFSVKGFKNQFNYTVPKYSVTVIRIHKN